MARQLLIGRLRPGHRMLARGPRWCRGAGPTQVCSTLRIGAKVDVTRDWQTALRAIPHCTTPLRFVPNDRTVHSRAAVSPTFGLAAVARGPVGTPIHAPRPIQEIASARSGSGRAPTVRSPFIIWRSRGLWFIRYGSTFLRRTAMPSFRAQCRHGVVLIPFAVQAVTTVMRTRAARWIQRSGPSIGWTSATPAARATVAKDGR